MDEKNTKSSEKEEQEQEVIYSFASKREFDEWIRKAPKAEWVKSRKLGGVKKSHYVPIGVMQALTDYAFQEINIIDENYKVIINEILCTVKIEYTPSYPFAETRVATGTATKPIQCSSGSIPLTFPKGKIINSLEYNAPAARSAALSNAVASLGNIFGRNLGRELAVDFSFGSHRTAEKKEPKKKSKKKKK